MSFSLSVSGVLILSTVGDPGSLACELQIRIVSDEGILLKIGLRSLKILQSPKHNLS